MRRECLTMTSKAPSILIFRAVVQVTINLCWCEKRVVRTIGAELRVKFGRRDTFLGGILEMFFRVGISRCRSESSVILKVEKCSNAPAARQTFDTFKSTSIKGSRIDININGCADNGHVNLTIADIACQRQLVKRDSGLTTSKT